VRALGNAAVVGGVNDIPTRHDDRMMVCMHDALSGARLGFPEAAVGNGAPSRAAVGGAVQVLGATDHNPRIGRMNRDGVVVRKLTLIGEFLTGGIVPRLSSVDRAKDAQYLAMAARNKRPENIWVALGDGEADTSAQFASGQAAAQLFPRLPGVIRP